MKRGQIIELQIQDMEFPSKGISYVDDKKVYVKNTLKGQKVKVKIIKNKREYAEGKLIDIIERSPLEAEFVCPHFEKCGGCLRQNVPYEIQLQIKSELVKKLLDEAGIEDYEFLGIKPSPNMYGYRNKMEYSFGDEIKGGEMTLGMHQRGKFYSIITVNQCKLVEDDFNVILDATLNYFKDKNIPAYNNKTHEGYLRHLVVRKGIKTGEILISLVTSTQLSLDLSEFVAKLKTLDLDGEIKGILHIFNDKLADAVQADKIEILWGQDYFYEEILGLKFKISPFSFFQTNSLGAEVLYNTALEFIESADDKTIFDLYCGTGTIGQIAAKKAKKVIGIEIVKEAVDAANENAKMNGLNNCEFIAGDVLEKINELKDRPDIIILDPPRAGVNPKALEKILKYKAKEIIYISCNPKTLAENLKQVKKAGYKVEKVVCVDMFPHTAHVESVVLIKRKHS
ncbi:23S rRNA (uracil-5-)-methyltransferase RumA [Caminicella sporogenes DSM 14501]|uniref:23S rRNA (Uracil-5-)-methyltransferase RumA n=1 Tax=Caminicella sporogenes DSM 14501 TaxID=1121266 RepID=A0A1M6N3J1_9FIRM|nr:23S rRNA (uracil(1939)-C(5))-methyltransferase RlmD [Caminicella sporogenes]RKD22379.1 23S rRNA (uracil-5-)-methyltransferase RumA [Caminicella sporogenes]SHJ90236.1 23S rRNA (uracil-5-)-methyltransferase RumA [Caminicella sporogenes DSM 14501]